MDKRTFCDYIINNKKIIKDVVSLRNYKSLMKTMKSMPNSLKLLLVNLKDLSSSCTASEKQRIKGIIDFIITMYHNLPKNVKVKKGSLEEAYFLLYYMLNDDTACALLEEWELKQDINNSANLIYSHMKKTKPKKCKLLF